MGLFTLKHGRASNQGVSQPMEKLGGKHLDSLERIYLSLFLPISQHGSESSDSKQMSHTRGRRKMWFGCDSWTQNSQLERLILKSHPQPKYYLVSWQLVGS